MSESKSLETKIIDAIYRGACETAEMESALELIAARFNSPGVFLGELDLARPESQVALGALTVDQEFFAEYGQYAALDPSPRFVTAMAAGTASTIERMIPQNVIRTSVFLNEFLMPRGVNGTLTSSLFSTAGRFAVIGIFQGLHCRSYDDDDIARLELLTPHLTRALQIRRLFLQSEARGKVFELIVHRNETAMVALRGETAALFVNNATQTLTRAGDGLAIDREGRLVVAERAAAKRLAALAADVMRGGAGGIVRIPRPSAREPYVVLVSRLPAGDDLFPNSTGGILYAIHDPARRPVPTEQRIAQLLHIPLGAAKVVQAMLEGIDLKDYAERAGVSMNTVKFHLKTAFARTETRSQANLVRVALAALYELGPYFSDWI